MQAILTQEKCIKAFKSEESMTAHLTQTEKNEMVDKAMIVIILCLEDKVLREVTRDITSTLMWEKHESLYMIKFLVHKLCLKQQLYSFQTVENKFIMEQMA